jgi:hypothetical protein
MRQEPFVIMAQGTRTAIDPDRNHPTCIVGNDDPAIRHVADAPAHLQSCGARGFDRPASACGARRLAAGAPSSKRGIAGISRALRGISACACMYHERAWEP